MSAVHLDAEPCTTVFLPHEPASVRVARLQMTAELRGAGLAEDLVLDAEIVLGELVANACEHGEPNERGEVEVSWCVQGDRLRISVVDGGEVSQLHTQSVDEDAERGRGLSIVDYICTNWSNDVTGGTRVTAELSIE